MAHGGTEYKVRAAIVNLGALQNGNWVSSHPRLCPRPGSGVRMAGAECVSERRGSHLPLKVLVELLAEAVDAGPVQLLVQGVCGSVWRREGQWPGEGIPASPTPCPGVWLSMRKGLPWTPCSDGPKIPALTSVKSTHRGAAVCGLLLAASPRRAPRPETVLSGRSPPALPQPLLLYACLHLL